MLPSKTGPVNKMPTNRWQQLYSNFFVLIVLASLLLTMLKSLTGGFTGFDENFFGKPRLISSFNYLRYSMGDQVFSQVLVGKEGWLQFSSEGNLNDYQNASIAPAQLERIHQKLEALNKELAARGITLIVIVAPSKATIYPDKVPEKLEKINEQSRLDLFLDLMKQTNSSYVIDLRPALIQASQNHQIYYKTDTHWNALGAYIAYREIMNTLSQAHPELQPYELDQFQWKESNPIVMDLPRLMSADFIREPWTELRPKFDAISHLQRFSSQSDGSMSWGYHGQEKTLVMYHDSFGITLHQFLRHHFKAAMFIPHRNSELSKTPWINVANPDIVIIEVAERDMGFLDFFLSKLLKRLPQQN